jgi:hypothetical protein
MARTVRIKKADDVCLNCIAFFPSELQAKDGTPLGECRRHSPQIVWHFDAKDIASAYPFTTVNAKCMEGMRKDGKFESFLARAIYKNIPVPKGQKK